jgi:2-hydroxy-6-oxonona-2,4-dienedioate hydrolase
MPDALSIPRAIRTVADLAAVDEAALHSEVPCGEGRMVWRTWGEGEPAVLLHGGSGSWSHWVRNIGALVSAGRQVWVPDLPGFGDSARPPRGGDADALPGPVEAALQTLIGDRQVDLIGFSFGSMVAAFMAAQRPDRVRRLVLAGAPGLGVGSESRLVLRPWSHLPPGEELEAAHRANLAIMMLSRPEAVDDLALVIHAANLARDRMKRRRLSRTDILRRTLAEVRCPVYGIWGSEDALYRGVIERLAPALADAARDFRGLTLIEGAGHWVQFECADKFDRALAEALV